MTDRELLRAAARSIGVNVAQGDRIAIDGKLWNPLAYTADAAELAINADLSVWFRPKLRETLVEPSHRGTSVVEPWGLDKAAATRRAIVRCAALIGAQS